MPNIGPLELIAILVIALLVLGPGKLPEVGSALGKSIREFRRAATDVQEAARVDTSPSTPTPPTPPVSPTAPSAVQPVGTTTASAPAPNTLSDQAAPNEISTETKA